ncbi:MAG: hypothetical protein KDD56_08515, partial [Bdellovibrionales bacterium]|nr:hypothetical protein [Bdellovibrionales bacterium]
MPIRTIETSELQIEATEIFMSRSNLTTTEFEHYKLSNNNLFVECGKLNRGRYFPEQQNVFEVDSSNTKKILDLDRDFITEKVTNHLNLDKPGDNNNLFDPGIFNISISTNKENFDTSTSLDTISTPTAKAPKILKKIAAGLRQLSTDKPCG